MIKDDLFQVFVLLSLPLTVFAILMLGKLAPLERAKYKKRDRLR